MSASAVAAAAPSPVGGLSPVRRRRAAPVAAARLCCPTAPRTGGKPDALVISGGGVKGLAALGAVYALSRRGHLRGVKTMVGTSAGALVCAALACGKDPVEVLRTLGPRAFKSDFDLGGLATAFGLDSGRGIVDLVDRVLGERYTFRDVSERHGVKLVVCVTNVTERRPEYLGPDTHPDMDIALALRMSCAVPLYFAAVRLEDAMFVDGVLTDNFPCEWALANGCREVLGIKFVTQRGPVASIDGYVSALVQCALWRHHPRKHLPGVTILQIDTPSTSSVNFTLQRAESRRLFREGARQARLWLKKTV